MTPNSKLLVLHLLLSLLIVSILSQKCDPQQYLDQTLNQCIPCSKVKIGCTLCRAKPEQPGKGICDGCSSNFIYNDPKNICECQENQFLDTRGLMCVNCTQVNQDAQCVSCVESENKGVGVCRACALGYGLNLATNFCKKCEKPNCAECSHDASKV